MFHASSFRFHIVSIIFLFLSSPDGVVGSENSEQDDELQCDAETTEQNEDLLREEGAPQLIECSLWLAPSSIEGAGLGVYAGRGYRKGEVIDHSGDVVIPIIDLHLHNRFTNYSTVFDRYTWSGVGLGISHGGYEKVSGFSPGVASTSNALMSGFHNIHVGKPQRDFHKTLHRSTEPGVGAYTPYFGRQARARRNILEGEELVLDYGESWFKRRAKFNTSTPMLSAQNLLTTRSREWFEKFGSCADYNI